MPTIFCGRSCTPAPLAKLTTLPRHPIGGLGDHWPLLGVERNGRRKGKGGEGD